MTNFIKIFLIAAFGCVVSVNLSAQAKISIQGTLKDAKGAAAADGVQTVTFKLYNVTTAGTALWSETADVNVSGGIYSHYLGSITPLNTSIFNSTLYLGVNIGALELSPRIELTYAPYAFAVQEVVCSGAVGDIKYSILNPTQFAAVNGSCWVPMDGRSIAGSRLNTILPGLSTVPNGGGMFLRAQEFSNSGNNDPNRDSNSPIAVFQDQATQTHQHSFSGSTSNNDATNFSSIKYVFGIWQGSGADPNRPSTTNANEALEEGLGAPDKFPNYSTVDLRGNHNHSFSGTTNDNNGFSGLETRPKNLNFWIYIRIN